MATTARPELERFARSKPEWNEPKTKPRSRLLEAVHESASGLHCEGLVTKRRMVEYDAQCLEPVPDYDAAAVRKLRQKLNLSQTVLAAVLNTSASTVRCWEGGSMKPTGSALNLLNLFDRKALEAVL